MKSKLNAREQDRNFSWHPFTQMKDWMAGDPIVIRSGRGTLLTDSEGRKYLDANSSIWTNLHGHNHPVLNQAVRRQLRKIAHSSYLGLANEPASELADKLVSTANPAQAQLQGKPLARVFYSDDGSTAMEVALKLSFEFCRRLGRSRKPEFLSMQGGYHGDTVGAVSLGKIPLFHKTWEPLLFSSDTVPSPFCYRCPHNRAKAERVDARESRKCSYECIRPVEKMLRKKKYAAFVVEPRMQGAAGMIPQPHGWFSKVAGIAREQGVQIIADEVMTGFGRTAGPGLFASHQERVQPDFLVLAKGLTGGYLPMAATLSTEPVFNAFLGDYSELKTFFHGHSYTGNQLGASAALANLNVLEKIDQAGVRQRLAAELKRELNQLWRLEQVGDIRQEGLVAGVELVQNWRTGRPFDFKLKAGIRVCEAMARKGVLTRPIGSVIVLMPPYCTREMELKKMVRVLGEAIEEVFGR